MKNYIKNLQNTQKGSLLLELLIVISLLAIILSVGASAIFLSMRSNKVSGERDSSSALASEYLEAARSIAEENWQNIYGLTKSTQHYFPTQSAGRWIFTAGSQIISVNNIIYTRYVVINNVSRDNITRNIQSSYLSANNDPSTQKITVTVGWAGANPLVISEYFFRWKNKVCNQTDWSGGVGSGVKNCPDTTYTDISPLGTIDTSIGGQLKLH